MRGPIHPDVWLWLGLVLYVVVTFGNPVRARFLDGFRALGRYQRLWGILAWCGVAHELFRLGSDLLIWSLIPAATRPAVPWASVQGPGFGDWKQLAAEVALPSIEQLAGLFNNAVTTFPLSAVAALLFLFNWQGHHGTLAAAIRKRFGRARWGVHGFVLLCALAACFKPVMYLLFAWYGRSVEVQWLLNAAAFVDWLLFIFEYLFGVCVQIYLILLAYLWIRGMSFTPQHLWDTAIRRLGAAGRWAGVVILLGTLFVSLPLFLASFPATMRWLSMEAVLKYVDEAARPVLAGFLLLFATMQIHLTFHAESLGEAVRSHWKFLRRHAWSVGWFLVAAATQVFVFQIAVRGLQQVVAPHWQAATLLRVMLPVPEALLIGWLLASWVSVFRHAESRATGENRAVRF